MKCPLCDGTVVNGRCKECGMPYRNDEILYHLNESRSDHYRHASDKARKIMQTQGVGSLGKGSVGKAAGNQNRSSGREKIRPAKTKKHSKLGILWVIIIILAAERSFRFQWKLLFSLCAIGKEKKCIHLIAE